MVRLKQSKSTNQAMHGLKQARDAYEEREFGDQGDRPTTQPPPVPDLLEENTIINSQSGFTDEN